MKPNELEYIANILKGTIETTVNGKIMNLTKEFKEYVATDIKWKEEKVEPLIDAHRTVKNMAIFVKWLAGGVVAVGVLAKAWAIGIFTL